MIANRICKRIGTRIRKARKARNWTFEALAEKSKLHPTYVSSIERGERNPTIGTLEKIARALGVRIVEFLDD